ncbi:hypothetical protein KIH39_11070 [Telmatocola sphagniphila]|uniref:Uncharacterized protein n=1 Tax=Telmatocola sphagniphila TaxID=1123043 RepID=A0A8E6EX21_9BACT|nr:hypothetical protein [Telmatocola sphagniphila]QVL34417.1 hypothetical protein KIH39_11070 [Telmatocola sphagniphila]
MTFPSNQSQNAWLNPIFRSIAFLGLALLLVSYAPKSSRADVVILKDGYTLHGKVFKDSVVEVDPTTGESFIIKAGFHKVDDGGRITVFSPNYRQLGDSSDFNRFADFVTLRTKFVSGGLKNPIDFDVAPKKDIDYDDRWMRKVPVYSLSNGRWIADLQQQIVTLTPHFIRIDSSSHKWGASYLTQEWGPEKVLKLLRHHPDLKEEAGKPEASKRKKLILFLIQANWFDYAQKEIDDLAKALPDDKQSVADMRKSLLSAQADLYLQELDILRSGGRYEALRKKLPEFPKEGIPAPQTLKYSTFKAEFEAQMQKLEKAQLHLEKLSKLQFSEADRFLIGAAKVIQRELHPDSISRLDTFVAMADQVERDIAQGRATTYKPEELLSLAVTGWLLGKSSAETKSAAAKKLWDARELLKSYLSTDTRGDRLTLLGKLEKNALLPPIDELAQIISLMPPPYENKDFSTAIKMYNTGPVKNYPKGVDFALQLPPEYHFARRTPLLILLPDGNEKPEDLIKKFGNLPARYGYIVAVPVWNGGIRATYTFTDDERGVVPALISHLERFLQIDSDRVFLFGCNEAGNMAYDVGLSHPDLFAGVTAMCPFPSARVFAAKSASPSKLVLREYWQNVQQLPLYLILADRVGDDTAKTIQMTLKNWMNKGFPVLAVAYKGRNPEFFFQELPFMFDWMVRKKRTNGLPGFGTPGLGAEGTDFRTMRQEDNHFYWVSTSEIMPGKTLERNPRGEFVPARIAAKAMEGNMVRIDAVGFRQLTVSVPRGLFELDKPIRIVINGKEWNNERKPLKPNLGVMLEDLYERGDRQHVYLEKFEFKGSPFLPK